MVGGECERASKGDAQMFCLRMEVPFTEMGRSGQVGPGFRAKMRSEIWGVN